MATRKVKLFVVEGPSEETAFALIFERIFTSDTVMFDVVHGDITTEPGIDTIRNKVRKQINAHIERQAYGWKDLIDIVHIVDTDGVFIDDSKVIAAQTDTTLYELDCIKSKNPEAIKNRNHIKANALNQLASIHEITYKRTSIPYHVYYLSRNLEHALHNTSECISDVKKEELARQFRQTYKSDLNGFRDFLKNEIGIDGDYQETWRYIREGDNSLKRGSNLHLVLE